MPSITSEYAFEEHIEQFLINNHGYLSVNQEHYNKKLCLLDEIVISFLRSSQTEKWNAYVDVAGGFEAATKNVLKRIHDVIQQHGTIHVLRKGFDIVGSGHFEMCYFEPTNTQATEAIAQVKLNLFHVQRQVKFSEADGKSLDLVIFLNGLPIFTFELKNQITGQTIKDAIRQYQTSRNPAEPLFKFKRCLAHFAVDNELVYVTTELNGGSTFFLPFNKGNNHGAGNTPSQTGYATSYLWEQILSKSSVLDLIQRFIRVVDSKNGQGKTTQKQIFPRYHQLTCVRELSEDVKVNGAGKRYLNQHSAGSGKTNCIAWLANALSSLHDANNQPIYSSVIVISDRRVIDRQLQKTLSQVISTSGRLVNIAADDGKTSKDLKTALQDGKQIIVTTIQKFSVIVETSAEMEGRNFAVIIDEAHSSQSGQSARAVQQVLGKTADEVASSPDPEEVTVEDIVLAALHKHKARKNVSYFAFTATPKPETLEQFGKKMPDGTFVPFSLYTMRQAIEEKFILDVLHNYTTYDQYWQLLKTVEDNDKYDTTKTKALLRNFVKNNDHTIDKKVGIIVDHFENFVTNTLNGNAKAMIVTSSREHAVRYKLALDKYLEKLSSPHKALVAFTDVIKLRGTKMEYTEASMNGFPEAQTAERFDEPQYKFLVVASKFQTGFDQPKLVAMYVDKKLSGVTCVQTLSRLNRVAPGKDKTFVLDFENTTDSIRESFQPFYDRVALSEGTDPNKLYDLLTNLENFDILDKAELEAFNKELYSAKPRPEKLSSHALPCARRWKDDKSDEEKKNFKSIARDFVKLYTFVTTLMPLQDANLAMHWQFLKYLLPLLPAEKEELPLEVLEMVDINALAIRPSGTHDIGLDRGLTVVDPMDFGHGASLTAEDKESLAVIVNELNETFGTEFSEDETILLEQISRKIDEDEGLQNQISNSSPHAARATFDAVMRDSLEDTINDNFAFYKKVTNDPEFKNLLFAKIADWYFNRQRLKPNDRA